MVGGASATAEARWQPILLALLLVILGAGVGLYHLDTVPPRISADEYSTASEVFEILHGKGPPLFGLDWKPMPALTEHVTALLMRAVGPTILGMRLLSILLGILAAVLLFSILRWSCSTLVAWVTAALMLCNPWFLNFMRSGWENLHVGAYWLLLTWCFFSGLRARRWTWLYYAGAGVALALSFYGYFAGRLILLSWLLYFPAAKLFSGRSWRHVITAYAVTSLTAAALFAPELPVVFRQWDRFQGRVRNVSIFSVDPAQHGYSSHLAMAAGQLARTARYLTIGMPIGGVHYAPSARPPFYPLLVPFLLIGMARAAIRWRYGLWWWLLVLVPVVATQGLSNVGDPNLARMAGTCVGFFWFIGYGLGAFAELGGKRLQMAVNVVLVAGALAIGVREWRFFQDWMLSDGVKSARGGGVDYQDYDRWQEIQFARIEAGEHFVNVLDWEKPEIRRRLLSQAPEGGGKPPGRE